jgi:hypothetical protein
MPLSPGKVLGDVDDKEVFEDLPWACSKSTQLSLISALRRLFVARDQLWRADARAVDAAVGLGELAEVVAEELVQ